MTTAAGIDPGTKTMDVYGFDDGDGKVLIQHSIPRKEVTENPFIVLDVLRDSGVCFDAVVAPSGYGMPLKKASEADRVDIFSATFMTEEDFRRGLNIAGLRRLMFLFKDSGLNVWFTPGVIHLHTVPEYRKINKIDMGTADKVFSAAACIVDEARTLAVDYSETSFINIEAGFGYTAALAVDHGQIVDGVGGTVGGLGFMGMGGLDGELAYAMANTGEFSKTLLFTGGAASIAGIGPHNTSIEDFLSSIKGSSSMEYETAYNALLESVLKDFYLMLSSVRRPREILLTGRLVRVKSFYRDVSQHIMERLECLGVDAVVRKVVFRAVDVKEAAVGAALLANGLAGGLYSKLVDCMRLRESSGNVFSHIYLDKELVRKMEEVFLK